MSRLSRIAPSRAKLPTPARTAAADGGPGGRRIAGRSDRASLSIRALLSLAIPVAILVATAIPAPAQQEAEGQATAGSAEATAADPEALPEELEMIPGQVARLQTLDKISARISTLEVPVGGTVTWERLDISVAKCARSSPFERPERAALLKIAERRRGLAPVEVFSGWMFASSPALHAMEHPVYDVLVTDCMSWSAAESGAPPAD